MIKIPEQKGKTELVCEKCGESFKVKNSLFRYRHKKGLGLPKFCSRKCKMDHDTAGTLELPCSVCGKLFKVYKYRRENVSFLCCSLDCMGEKRKTGDIHKCAECGVDIYVSGHRSKRHKTFFCKNSCRLKYQFRNNKSWEGFVYSTAEYKRLSDRIRKSAQGRSWKNAILERDGKRCTKCESTVLINAHHFISLSKIISDNDFDEAKVLLDPRFTDLSNGTTLCRECHALVHGLKSLHKETCGRKSGELLETPNSP